MSDNTDLDELLAEQEEASRDKADLFDFYNKNFGWLVGEVAHQRELVERFEKNDARLVTHLNDIFIALSKGDTEQAMRIVETAQEAK